MVDQEASGLADGMGPGLPLPAPYHDKIDPFLVCQTPQLLVRPAMQQDIVHPVLVYPSINECLTSEPEAGLRSVFLSPRQFGATAFGQRMLREETLSPKFNLRPVFGVDDVREDDLF